MNRLGSMNSRRLVFFGILLLLVSVVLFFWLREVVREVIVIPISYLFYVAGILIDATPQLFFWLAVLFIAFWIAYRSLSSRRRRVIAPVPVVSDELPRHAPNSGRVTFWANRVNLMHRYRSDYYQGSFHQSLGRLLLEVLAHRYRMTLSQVEERLRGGALDIPPEVREYVRLSLGRQESVRSNFFTYWWNRLGAMLRAMLDGRSVGIALEDHPRSPVNGRVERIIQYMEEELEVSHDHPSR